MQDKLFGIGLGNAISLFILFILLSVALKAFLVQVPVKGLSEVVNAA